MNQSIEQVSFNHNLSALYSSTAGTIFMLVKCLDSSLGLILINIRAINATKHCIYDPLLYQQHIWQDIRLWGHFLGFTVLDWIWIQSVCKIINLYLRLFYDLLMAIRKEKNFQHWKKWENENLTYENTVCHDNINFLPRHHDIYFNTDTEA